MRDILLTQEQLRNGRRDNQQQGLPAQAIESLCHDVYHTNTLTDKKCKPNMDYTRVNNTFFTKASYASVDDIEANIGATINEDSMYDVDLGDDSQHLNSNGLVPIGRETPDKSTDADCCSVCLSSYEEGELLIVLPCRHHYHKLCLSEWLSGHTTCPLCKHDLLPLFAPFLTNNDNLNFNLNVDTNSPTNTQTNTPVNEDNVAHQAIDYFPPLPSSPLSSSAVVTVDTTVGREHYNSVAFAITTLEDIFEFETNHHDYNHPHHLEEASSVANSP
jgi:hypothetical protein